jgi:hypothetical protein
MLAPACLYLVRALRRAFAVTSGPVLRMALGVALVATSLALLPLVSRLVPLAFIGSRAGLRLLTPPLQRRTHCTPGCAPLKRRKHSAARWTCAAASNVRSSPLCADMVCKSGNSSADALFTQGLMALMQPIICCVRAQSTREFVTEFSGGATPHRSGVAQS